jgi:hypothetical protein
MITPLSISKSKFRSWFTDTQLTVNELVDLIHAYCFQVENNVFEYGLEVDGQAWKSRGFRPQSLEKFSVLFRSPCDALFKSVFFEIDRPQAVVSIENAQNSELPNLDFGWPTREFKTEAGTTVVLTPTQVYTIGLITYSHDAPFTGSGALHDSSGHFFAELGEELSHEEPFSIRVFNSQNLDVITDLTLPSHAPYCHANLMQCTKDYLIYTRRESNKGSTQIEVWNATTLVHFKTFPLTTAREDLLIAVEQGFLYQPAWEDATLQLWEF